MAGPVRLVLVAALWGGMAAQACTAGTCSSLVPSVCDGAGTAGPAPPGKTLKVAPRDPDFAVGERFPVEEHSLLMNPVQYGLPAVDGPWRYYAFNYFVYRVASDNAEVLEVIDDSDVIRRLP